MITFNGKLTGKSEDFFWNKKSLKEKMRKLYNKSGHIEELMI